MDIMRNEPLEAFDRSIDVHISRIRAAIEDDPAGRAGSSRSVAPAMSSPRRRTNSSMRHLYHQLYLTIIASLLLVVVVAGLLWRLGPSDTPGARAFEIAGELMAAELPPPSAAPATQQAAIDRLHDRLDIDLGLFDGARRLVAAAGRPAAPPPPPASRMAGSAAVTVRPGP